MNVIKCLLIGRCVFVRGCWKGIEVRVSGLYLIVNYLK